jgi:hypothetical protein
MAEDQQNNPDQNQQSPEPPSPPSGEHQDSPPADSSETTPANQTSEYVQQQLPNIIVNYEKADDIQAIRANQIGNRMFWATVVSGGIGFGLLIATFFVWKATQGSVDVANTALSDEHRKDSLARITDSITLRRQDSMFQVNRLDVQNRFRLDSNSTADQIKVLKGTLAETKREFKASNEPYLNITEARMIFRDSPIAIGISYQLENLKPLPAQIISKIIKYTYSPIDTLNVDSIFNTVKASPDLSNAKNGYVIKEAPIPVETMIDGRRGLTPNAYLSIKSNNEWFYIICIIKYKDLASGTSREYRCIVTMKNIVGQNGRFYVEYQYNENKDAN